MRTSRALVLVATLSLGTFAFAQEASYGTSTGEFQSAPANSVTDSGSNGDPAKAGTTFGPNGTIVNSATENTGDFETYTGPRRYVGGNGDTAQAERNSADFGSSTGDFQAAPENAPGTYGAPGASNQPGSMGSNAGSDSTNSDTTSSPSSDK